ncbi:hypothetical protein [Chitiniphilus eburneus]|uniref:Uncharacterized protein n=1 Tax=Chitiniphilus eburneus TaxID=2571148 RepID=A0A4U0Q3X5_9NEIS|nr:hypothetical protein [Chitiniphilus eburneus]TJZ74802.1 hypothetical protein FAZ21_07470 [Chitiniphilus eburneus]
MSTNFTMSALRGGTLPSNLQRGGMVTGALRRVQLSMHDIAQAFRSGRKGFAVQCADINESFNLTKHHVRFFA